MTDICAKLKSGTLGRKMTRDAKGGGGFYRIVVLNGQFWATGLTTNVRVKLKNGTLRRTKSHDVEGERCLSTHVLNGQFWTIKRTTFVLSGKSGC